LDEGRKVVGVAVSALELFWGRLCIKDGKNGFVVVAFLHAVG